MYDFFIDQIMIPIYKYVLKPMKLITYFLWLFIKYVFVALTGNIILMLIMILILSNINLTYVMRVTTELTTDTILIIIILCSILLGIASVCFLYNFFNLFSYLNREDIIDKEPEFVKNIGDVVACTYVKILKDVKSRDGKQQNIRQKKKENIAAKKAIKMAEKRIKKEKEQIKLNMIHNRSEILDL